MRWAAVAVAALLVASCKERFSTTYATFADAERAGATQHGWIPEFVPASATEISEAHDLDTNLQRIRFRAPSEALERMAAALEPLPPSRATPSGRLPAVAGSWPRALDEGHVPPAFRTYVHRRPAPEGKSPLLALPPLCVAIDPSGSTAYVWTCAELG